MSLFEHGHVHTIKPGCPWYEMQQTFGGPNVDWCEPTICAVINEPANTWSNLGFMLVALLIWKASRQQSIQIRSFAWITMFVGIVSFTYHATNNYLTQVIDLSSNFLLTVYPLGVLVVRANHALAKHFNKIVFGLLGLNMAEIYLGALYNMPIQSIVMGNIVIWLIGEAALAFKGKSRGVNFRPFALACFFMAVAQICSQIDLKRIYCNPENVFLHGHVLWHLFGAVGVWFMYRYFEQFSYLFSNLERNQGEK